VIVASWALGWEALVAIATFALAFATAVLAALTWRVAKAATADVEAQWRPVLVPLEAYGTGNDVIVILGNDGRGPALDISAELDGNLNAPNGVEVAQTGIAGPVLSRKSEKMLFHVGAKSALEIFFADITISYTDMSQGSYETHFVIETRPGARPTQGRVQHNLMQVTSSVQRHAGGGTPGFIPR
jgi:hypothetical protein